MRPLRFSVSRLDYASKDCWLCSWVPKSDRAAKVSRLGADFSEAELKKELNLSKQPVMNKLLQSEVKTYMATFRLCTGGY
jgi:hypothetical protein